MPVITDKCQLGAINMREKDIKEGESIFAQGQRKDMRLKKGRQKHDKARDTGAK